MEVSSSHRRRNSRCPSVTKMSLRKFLFVITRKVFNLFFFYFAPMLRIPPFLVTCLHYFDHILNQFAKFLFNVLWYFSLNLIVFLIHIVVATVRYVIIFSKHLKSNSHRKINKLYFNFLDTGSNFSVSFFPRFLSCSLYNIFILNFQRIDPFFSFLFHVEYIFEEERKQRLKNGNE